MADDKKNLAIGLLYLILSLTFAAISIYSILIGALRIGSELNFILGPVIGTLLIIFLTLSSIFLGIKILLQIRKK